MPIMNLFKNCSYYWGFAGYISYHINHPLYTSPSSAQVIKIMLYLSKENIVSNVPVQVYTGLGFFLLCELGNFACHLLFRC